MAVTAEGKAPAAGKAVKPFRFGVQAFNSSSASEWEDMAHRSEALGYSTLHLSDHYLGPGRVHEESHHPVQVLAALPAMCFAAAATSTLRIGSRMLCVDYHVPATLAKEAATLDMLSEGRLELGLGAGWVKAEYRGMGIEFNPAETRIARLAEVVDLMRQHFSGDQIDLQGEHVQVDGYAGEPPPAQAGGIPIMIGGGSKRVLTLAAQVAEIVSVNWTWRSGNVDSAAMASSAAPEMAKKIGWVRAAAEERGRWDEIEIETATPFLYITDDVARTCEKLSPKLGIDPEQVLEYPYALIGSVDAICDMIEERRELYGISYVTVLATRLEPEASGFEDFVPVVERLTGK